MGKIPSSLIAALLVFSATEGGAASLEGSNMTDVKSLINLAYMAMTHIPCDFPYFPIPYGCWCGITLHDHPYPPVDELDASCKIHDKCYEDSDVIGCNMLDQYLYSYDWDHVDGKIVCSEDNEPCQKRICECDKEVIEALTDAIPELGCPRWNPGCS